MNTKIEDNIERYLKTSIYTYAGAYRELLVSLPDDIAVIGKLVCAQITHPSMYFTIREATSNAALCMDI